MGTIHRLPTPKRPTSPVHAPLHVKPTVYLAAPNYERNLLLVMVVGLVMAGIMGMGLAWLIHATTPQTSEGLATCMQTFSKDTCEYTLR